MQIQIKVKGKNANNFIYNYLPDYIYREFVNKVDGRRLKLFDDNFKIDSFSLLRYTLKHLLITRVRDDTYIIKVNESLTYRGHKLIDYINLITYGTRQIRGYGILIDIFRETTQQMNIIYDMWQLGIK